MKAGLLIALLIFALPVLADDFVNNGTFDGGSCAGWVAAPTPFNTPGYNECRVSGGDPGGYAVLNDYPAVVVTMSQVIAGLIVGDEYQLSWDMESAYHAYGSDVTAGAGAAIDGNVWQFIVPNSQGWTPYSETFTYSGISNTLVFSAQLNGTDTDAGFDNIQLDSVPEPSTLALVCGACAIFLLRRRHS